MRPELCAAIGDFRRFAGPFTTTSASANFLIRPVFRATCDYTKHSQQA
jgi:hypothetical protein